MRIDVRNLAKRFGAVVVVNGVDFSIADGELFTLLGPSGCGKTTLLRLIAGFYAPDAGEILFDGRRVNDVPPYEREIGMVFQNYALWPHMTAFENVAYGLKLRKTRASEITRRVEAVFEKVKLAGLGNRYPRQLSGGQQQRVALARALVLSPSILLLDEPLSNLDAKIRVQVRAEIRKLQQELRITTVYVTHDQEEALTLSDRIAVFNQGRIYQVGAPRALYERPANRFVADFIGISNLIEGTVQSIDRQRQRMLVHTAVGELSSRCDDHFEPGHRCVVSVRPENAELGGVTADDCNQVQGRIAFAAYLGNTLRYDVDLGHGIMFKLDVRDPWHHGQREIDSPVTVSFPASSTVAVRPD